MQVANGPESLRPESLGAWLVPDLIASSLASDVMEEVYRSGQLEPIRASESQVAQQFERLIVDLTKENDYPKLEELGLRLGGFAVSQLISLFPSVDRFSIDEAAVQVYPPDTLLGLGWHRDHINDEFVVISAVLSGSGDISFTSKTPVQARQVPIEEAIEHVMTTEPLSAVLFRSTGLYEHDLDQNINPTHAVTRIRGGEERFTVQYRMNVNASDYSNIPVNVERPKYEQRKQFLYPDA